jgi:hypothetical protein
MATENDDAAQDEQARGAGGGWARTASSGTCRWHRIRRSGSAGRPTCCTGRARRTSWRSDQAARELGVPHFLLGLGANILVADAGFRGLVIRSEVGGIEFIDDTRVRAGAGVHTFMDLINATVSRGLGGLHHYVGIPSTVGGAIWQNLHFLSPPPERERTCFIEEVVESAEILTEEGERAPWTATTSGSATTTASCTTATTSC